MAAGLSKLFRPAAPSSLMKKRSSRVQVFKGGRGEQESISTDASSVIGKCADYITDETHIAANAYKDSGSSKPKLDSDVVNCACEENNDVVEPNRQQQQQYVDVPLLEQPGPSKEINSTKTPAKPVGAKTTEWSQIPGSIFDPDDHGNTSKRRYPPAVNTSVRSFKLGGAALEPQDIDSVPQPDKKYLGDVRTRRVMKEFRAVIKACNRPNSIFSVDLVDDNLYDWKIKLFGIDPLSLLYCDMENGDIPYILFNMTFPENFPFSPPFVRVVSPRIENGYVMDGGAICMELLTEGGWSSAYTIEAIVMQLGATLVAGHARLATGRKYRIFGDVPFNKQEAIDSFSNVEETHKKYGWATPAGEFS